MSETLGQYLRTVREQNKLSTRDVEKSTGITTSQLSRLECNITRNPSPVALKKLALFYNCLLYTSISGRTVQYPRYVP